jgi:hypothetical protein
MFASTPTSALASSAWPASAGADIGLVSLAAAVPAFDASGLVYDSVLGALIGIGDDGDVVMMNTDGSGVAAYSTSGDPEDITITVEGSNIVYLSDENAGTVAAFNLSTGALTGSSWTVSSYITTATGQGIEAMTFVPNGYHPYADSTSGGLFYVGSQYNGDIAVLDIDTSTSGSVSFIDTISTGRSDLSGLNWNSDTQTVYAEYDGHDLLAELESDGTLVNEYAMTAGINQEGITIVPDCATGTADVYVADDGGPNVWKHTGYPIDTDTVYADADSDGLGNPSSTAMVCVGGSSAGYVSNSDDTNDTIPNAGIEISGVGKDNDGDSSIDEYNTIASNGAHPYYSTLSASDTSAYGSTITSVKMVQKSALLLVTFSDSSVYSYTVWSGRMLGKPWMTATSVKNSAYILVSYEMFSWRIYNGYDGSLVTSTRGFMTKAAAQTWAIGVLGL